MRHAYLFEAKGIQRYIFASGRLRDIIGASDLVAKLASSDEKDLVNTILGSISVLPAGISFSRRAGGAFCIHGTRAFLEHFRARWRMAVMSALPGLEFADGMAEGANQIAAMRSALGRGSGLRSNAAATVLPMGTPPAVWAPLTGRPAVGTIYYRNRAGIEDEVLTDAMTRPQRLWGDDLQGKLDGVAARLLGTSSPRATNRAYVFPRNLDPREEDRKDNPLFPFRTGEDLRIAIVHADISGLGEAFRIKGADFTEADQNRALANRIEAAVLQSVQQAAAEILLDDDNCGKKYDDKLVTPVRPVVIGGDDLTLIVRADLALRFTVRLLKLIEEQTADPAIGGLSACAGIAFVQKGMPFLTAYGLADSLCSFAKKSAKSNREAGQPFPSALAFHHQTQTATEAYERTILPELRSPGGVVSTANPYALDERAARTMRRPSIEQLITLAKKIAVIEGSAGALREAKELLATSEAMADARWHRLRATIRNRERQSDTKILQEFDDALRAMGVAKVEEGKIPHLPEAPPPDNCPAPWKQSPLFDALILLDLHATESAPEADVQAAA